MRTWSLPELGVWTEQESWAFRVGGSCREAGLGFGSSAESCSRVRGPSLAGSWRKLEDWGPEEAVGAVAGQGCAAAAVQL